MNTRMRFAALCACSALMLAAPACGTRDSGPKAVTITLGAYTVTQEVYDKEIIPAFQGFWRAATGQTVRFRRSYEPSGAQSRAIQAGFAADVAALSLVQDVEAIRQAGLITADWRNFMPGHGGIVTRSMVVIAYRPGNPKNITGFGDLARDDVDVLCPDPKTSGGAMWCINAVYGAGLKLSEAEGGAPDPLFARELLKGILRRITVMDKSARLSVASFESGAGDALLTYENEALLRQRQGREFPFMLPEATIFIENPVAIVDRNVEKHGNREAVEAFVRFLYSEQAQRAFADHGFRPVDQKIAEERRERYPVPPLAFDIRYLGGWPAVSQFLYGPEGIWAQITGELRDDR